MKVKTQLKAGQTNTATVVQQSAAGNASLNVIAANVAYNQAWISQVNYLDF
jgi:hypothetical protein